MTGRTTRVKPVPVRLCAASLLLLGALWLVPPAEAQWPCTPSYAEDIWCATMTVGEFTSNTASGPVPAFGYINANSQSAGSLSDDDFTYDSESYSIRYLRSAPVTGRVDFALNPKGIDAFHNEAQFTLHAGGREFSFGDSLDFDTYFVWATTSPPSLPVDDQVILRLTDASVVREPGAPGSLSAMPRDDQVTLAWTPTADEGGSPVTGYEYRYRKSIEADYPDSWTAVADGPDERTATVTVPEAGVPYRFQLRARNRVKAGDAIEASTPPPTLSVSVGNASIAEAGGSSIVTVSTVGGSSFATDQTITLTLGGTATKTDDYTISAESLTLTAGNTSVTATVTAVQDTIDDDAETVLITATHNGATIGTQQTVTITDDDDPPTLSVSVNNASIAENGGTSTVTVSTGSGATFSADQTITLTLAGTATEATDYTITSKSLTLTAGASSVTGTVTAVQDTIDDDAETVLITATHNGSAIGTQQSITVTDDDAAPSLVVSVNPEIIAEAGGTSTVTLGTGAGSTFATAQTITLTLTGTATEPADYTIVSKSLTLPAGVGLGGSQVSTSVSGVNDAIDEPEETILIDAAIGTGAVGTQQTITITDDDDVPTVTLVLADGSIRESDDPGTPNAEEHKTTATASLSNPSAEPTTVRIVPVPGAFTVSGPLTIPAGRTASSAPVTLTAVDNATDAPDATVTVSATASNDLAVTDPEDVTLTIRDEDASTARQSAAIRIASTFVPEGDAITFTVTLAAAATQELTVDYATSVGVRDTAAQTDFTADSGTLTFAVGESQQTLTVSTLEDRIDESDETFTVTLDGVNPPGAATLPADPTATGTIVDDDNAPVLVLSVNPDTIAEGGGTSTVTISTGTDSTFATAQTITLALNGTATEATDYTIASKSLTLPAGSGTTASSISTTITAVQDRIDDDAETIIVTATHNSTAIGTRQTVSIIDDDAPALGIASASATEGDAVTFTVMLAPAATRQVTVDYATSVAAGDTAAQTDFASVRGTVTFGVGETQRTFTVSTLEDRIDESDETFTVTLDNVGPSGAATLPGDPTATGTIIDDDASPTVTLSLSDASIGEDAGVATVRASLSHGSSVVTTVTVSVSPDATAVAGDYSISANKSLSIAAEATSSTGAVTITGVDNDVDAADKTVQVKGAASNTFGISGPADVELTLEDDDARGVTVSKTDLDIAEGGDGDYTVVLTSEPTGQVTVTPSRSSGDTDVTVSGAVTFTAGNWSTARTVTVSAGQDTDAADDTAVIGHTVSGADYGSVTAASVDVTVDDDETASSGVILTVVPESVSEGANATTVTVTAGLNGGTRGDATPVAVTVGSGTAESGTDFAAVAGFTISIPANTQSHTGTFSLGPTQDTVDEPDETVSVAGTTTVPGFSVTGATVEIVDDDASPTVTLSLSDASIGEDAGVATVRASLSHGSSVVTTVTVSVSPDGPATSSDYSLSANKVLTIAAEATSSTGAVTITGVDNDVDAADKTVQVKGAASNTFGISGPADVELTLEDDDTRGVTVSKTDLDIAEGGDGDYTVVLTSEPTGQVTVTPSRSSGDPDVTVSGAVTFTAGNWSTARTVTVSAGQDSDAADDTAVIGHTVSGADYGSVTAASVDVTVDDDETASSGVILTVVPESVSEGAGATTVTVTARLNGGTRGDATPVAVTVGSGTAESGTDFAAVAGFTISIPANTQSHTGTFSLGPTQDTVDEPDETVSVAGTTTVPGFSVTGATVEIVDDDASPTVTLSLSDASIGEDAGVATVRASLSHGSSVVTTVTVSVSPDGPATSSDYSLSANKVLTIAAEATSSTGAVTITGVDNDVDAADKTVQVKGAASNTFGISGPADVELTLEDDDTRGVTVSKTDLDIAEGGDGDYTVVLTSEPTGQVTVTPSRSSGDPDVTVSGAVTFTAGNWSTARTVTVSAGQDSDAADDTAVIGHTVSGADYGSVTAASVDVTVDDDETASSGVILTVVPESVSEGAGATTVTVTARLNGGTRGDATPVAVTVGSGTAESGTDFAAVAGFTISIPANTQSHTGTFSLGPTQDTVDEPDETVSVAGTTTVPGFSVTGATVEIVDDDASPTVTLSLSDASIGEDAGVATVRASLSHGSSVVTTVTVSVSPDATATSSDYSLSANKVLTIAAEATSSTGAVTITGVDNDVDAADKTVQVQGAAVNSLGVTGPSDVELTLEDDDTRGVTVSKTDLDIAEGGDGDYTVVLTSEPTGQVTVTPSRSSGDTDVTVSGAVTFTAGNWSTARTVTVSAGQDTDAADDTAVIGHAVSGADYGSATAASVDVTVDDDETASSGVTLTVVPESVSEGANATTVTVTAGLNGGTRGDATPVAVTVGSGTAESGTDFAAVAGFTISIPANTQSHTGTFSLGPTQDTVDEPDETVSVAGTTTVPGFSVTGATVEIVDDDASPTVTLSLSDASIGEDAGVATVMASLSHGSSVVTTVTVSVSPDGPAVAGDYSISANKSLSIEAEATSSTGMVTITAVDNDVDAVDKTVQVQGAAVNSLGVTGPADVELTLEDDDARGVTVSKTDLDIAEGGDGDYTVVLTSEPTGQVTVTPSRSSGDPDVTVSGAVTFTAGNWSTARTVTVSAGQDTDAADDTAVIGHTVSGADYGSVTASSVDVTVDDDETASSGVTLTVVPESVSEGANATTVTVTAGLNGGTRGDATPVAVTVGSGTAESGTDFAAVAGFTISIPANTQSHTGTFSLSPTQDTVDEPDETVSVAGTTTVPGFSVTGATVEIIDDDATPTVTLTLSDASIGEDGGSTTVTASLSHASSVATAITVSASPVSPAVASDYNLSANKVLSIAAEAASSTGAVTITGVDNDVDAVDKTVQVKGAASNTFGISGPADVELTLEDDDTRGVAVSKTDLDIAEGGDGDYTVVLTSEPAGQVTVTPSRRSGDTDVTVSGAVTFTAEDWSTARTVTVSAGQDSDAADDTAVIGHTVSGADYGGATASSVDVTVDDDETASSGVTLTVVPESVSEGANATTVTVTAGLNGGTRGEATAVAVTVGSGTAISGTDFTSVSGFTIDIPPNTRSHTGTFSLSPTQDTVDEPDETVSVAGTTTVSGFSVTGATVEITDDDASPTVTLSLSDASIGEDAGVSTVTASLSHGSSVATTVTVSVSPDATATSSDYSLSANKVLTIGAGATGSTGEVTISGVDNDVDAVDKTVQVKGAASNTFGISGPADVALTLEDDDTRGVAVSKTDLDIAEGGDGDYTVVLTSEPTGQVTVTPSRRSGDTDVTVSGAVTFTAEDWSTARTVTVSAGQDSDAADDTAVIGHTVSGADYGGATASSVDVTVDDDETASSGVTLTVVPESVSEGANATTVTVTAGLNGGTRGEATAVAVTVGSGTAISGTDFTSVSGFTIDIPPNTQSHTGTFSLSPTQDTVDEPDETVSVAGTTTVSGFSVTGATVEITDDDASPTVTLSLSDASIGEDAGVSTVTASLSHGSSVATTVTVSVSPDATATSSDYSLSANKVLTIGAGATGSTGEVTISGVDNDVDAADKTVQVKGAASNTFGISGPADVELTLEDDDTRGVTVSKTDLDIAEGGDGDYTVVLTSEPTGQVTVTPSRSSGDPDVTVSGAVTFTAGNWSTARTVTVSAGQDSDAADDTAVIGHTVSGADYGSVTAASVDVTVDDDETASSGVILTVVPESVSEGAGATTVTVTAGLNGGTRGEATAVAVTVGSGTAISGTDFTSVSGFTIDIPANTRSHTGTFSLSPTQDTVDEPDETVLVGGSVSGLTVTGSAIEIIDDDASPTVTLSLSDASIGEDAGVSTVTASLSHGSSVATTVTVSVSPDATATSSDYSLSANKVLTIAAEATSSTGAVTITGVDNQVDAADKTVQVEGAAVNSLGVTGPSDVELTLEDDDARGVTVSKTELDIAEGGDGDYTVVLTSEPTGQVTVTPSRRSGDTDVTVSGAVTFTAEDWSTARTVTVSAGQDSDAADDTAVIGHTVSGADYGGATASSVDVTVDDDETASSGVTLTVVPESVSEGAGATTVTVTAGLNGGTRGEATAVAVTVGSGTAISGTDFTSVSGFTIDIPPNTQSHTGTFSLSPTQDTVDEPDETVSVAGTTTVSGFSVTGATVEITDDDASPTVTLSLSDASIGEDAGVATVTASLSHGSSVATTVTVSVSPDATATSSDYSLSANKVLSIAAGGTDSTGVVTISGVENQVDAADKTVQVEGAAVNSLGVTGPSDVELTLEDDDARGVTVSKTELDIAEGGDGDYTVVLTSEPTGQVTVTPARRSGDADVTVSGALTFTAEDWNTARTVTVSAGQDSDAADDTAVIGHTVSGADYGGVTAASVNVTVDEDALPTLTLALTPARIAENGGVSTVRATVSPASTEAFTVTVSAEAVDPAVARDFIQTGATLSFAADATESTGEVTITAVDNDEDTPDKTLNISGTVSVGSVTAPGDAKLMIDDDDSPPQTVQRGVAVEPPMLTIGEGDQSGGIFHVKLVAAPSANVTVAVSAPAGSGLTAVPPELRFSPGNWAIVQTVTVTAAEDEDNEPVTVRLTYTATGAGYEDEDPTEVAVTVTDRIDPGRPELRIADARGTEADGQLVFDLTLSRPATGAVSVAFETRDGTARAGEDYDAVAGIASIAAGERGTRIAVPLHVDLFREADETVLLMLSGADGARLAEGQATGVIGDEPDMASQWLARFGRIAGDHVMAAVEEQITAPRGGSHLTVAGHRFGGGAGTFGADARSPGGTGLAGFGQAGPASWSGGADASRGFAPAGKTLGGRELLGGSAFLLNAGPGGGQGAAVWGRTDYTRFEHLGEGLQTPGEALSATVGVDFACARCLLGIALSHTSVEADYGVSGQASGRLESSVTGLYPYFGVQLAERFSVWGLAGQGRGELVPASATGARTEKLDIETGLAGLGARAELISPDKAFSLAVKTEAFVSRATSGEAEGILEAEGEWRRVRLGLEGAWLAQFDSGASLRSSVEVAALEDAGDAENGRGAEVAASVRVIDVTPGLSLSLSVRGLVSHESEDYAEWGGSGALRYDPDPSSAAGPVVSLTHTFGAARGGGLQQALRGNGVPRMPMPSLARPEERLGAQFAWGFDAFGALGVPWARVGTTGAGQDYRVGYSLFTHRGTPSLELARSALGREIRLGWTFALRCRAQVAVQVLHGGAGPGNGTDTGFELTFRSIAPVGRPGAASCKTLQPRTPPWSRTDPL